jgi:hypothetical protein
MHTVTSMFPAILLQSRKLQLKYDMGVKNLLSYICLGYFVCVCVSQFVAERLAILFVLVIKLTKETRRRV